jgi:hypothetical protein
MIQGEQISMDDIDYIFSVPLWYNLFIACDSIKSARPKKIEQLGH